MLAKRIIPCLDVKDGVVVKGIQFKDHQRMGDILEYAHYYRDAGADELVFYDITASSDGRKVDKEWIKKVAQILDIPFTVAGGIRSVKDAKNILNAGADKISINSPALENPQLINDLANELGSQCVVVGIDSYEKEDYYFVCQYTGDIHKTRITERRTEEWVSEVQQRGAGEIVLNCMNQDGTRQGYDIKQLANIRAFTSIPLIASGGAGSYSDFYDVFKVANVDGALAASVFHRRHIAIAELKNDLYAKGIEVRL